MSLPICDPKRQTKGASPFSFRLSFRIIDPVLELVVQVGEEVA